MLSRVIFSYVMLRSRRQIVRRYGVEFWKSFRKYSSENFREVLPKVPNIGRSVFSLNYRFLPVYVAWYRAFQKLGLGADEIDRCIWMMNDQLLAGVSGWCTKAVGRQYYRSFQRKAASHVERQTRKKLHPLDWQIAYRAISDDAFEIDILTCPFERLSKDFGEPGLLPGICRMDYLFANRMGNGFVRTKTLGDGDDCCNCHYEMTGNCAWAPETGFLTRK